MADYDVLIIGAGPAGYVCAIRAAQLGLNTAIVERKYWGGVCLNLGCIPTKALLKNAELARILRERAKEFGIAFDGLRLDYAAAHKRSRRASARLVKGVGFLMKKNGIATYEGSARLLDAHTVAVSGGDGEITLMADNIVIATGARPRGIPGVEIDGERVITYNEAIMADSLPDSVVIVGAGAIGLEFATIWHSYGVEVTIVEMLPHLAPLEDEAISEELERQFKRAGIKFMTSTRLESVELTDGGVKVTVSGESGTFALDAEKVLMAIGVRPNVGGMGLEEIGVRLDRRGFIAIDERMATNVPGVWAIGDVTGKLLLAHVGSAQGIVAAENIAGVETIELDYVMMPRCTYSHPQIASFGYTESGAREKGYDVKVSQFPFQANGKALGLGDYAGFVKLIADAESGRLLGAHMIGPDVTELLPELTLAQMAGLTGHEIARNVHAHPTLSEALMEAAHGLVGHPIHL